MTVQLESSWRCIECDEHGEGPRSDLEARNHTDAGHGTLTFTRPAPKETSR